MLEMLEMRDTHLPDGPPQSPVHPLLRHRGARGARHGLGSFHHHRQVAVSQEARVHRAEAAVTYSTVRAVAESISTKVGANSALRDECNAG